MALQPIDQRQRQDLLGRSAKLDQIRCDDQNGRRPGPARWSEISTSLSSVSKGMGVQIHGHVALALDVQVLVRRDVVGRQKGSHPIPRLTVGRLSCQASATPSAFTNGAAVDVGSTEDLQGPAQTVGIAP